ncbi:MAG: RagB/SusD family nutrient uptake outer membrane protein [Muribaculaceae bacterium]|nr:RagB/SusD family nutrient uptake outer membrane protein [Muribaculaceae bacterium]
MKKYISIIAGMSVAAFALTPCSEDFLEVTNPTGEPLEEYYTTDAHLNEALTSAYAPLHWPDWDGVAYNDLTVDAEILGDDFWVGGSSISDNQHWHKLFNFEGDGNNTLSTLWGDFYSGIKRCNDVIKYCSWGGGTEANRKSFEMQARLLRVYYYNILWHYYGNVPFYLENLSEPYTAPQLKADEIYDLLLPELEEIIASGVLPMRWPAAESGRVSQAMAYMLYAEMVMYQNDAARYPKALAFMKEIIKDADYKLNPDFADLWAESGEWCAESIFEINYDDDNGQRDWSTSLYAGGTVFPTLCSPNSWGGGEGWDGGNDGWGFLPMRVETYNMYAENDVRRDVTCWDVRGYTYTERYQDTHIWHGKYRPQSANNQDCPTSKNLNYNNNKRIYRYAETLLNAAELLLQTGGSAGEALGYVNEVRARAGLSNLGSVTIDDIFTERHLEFCGEGKRYFDLVRAEGISGATQKASTVLVPDSYGYRTNSWTPSKKHIRLAQSELDADPTLVQNNY